MRRGMMTARTGLSALVIVWVCGCLGAAHDESEAVSAIPGRYAPAAAPQPAEPLAEAPAPTPGYGPPGASLMGEAELGDEGRAGGGGARGRPQRRNLQLATSG